MPAKHAPHDLCCQTLQTTSSCLLQSRCASPSRSDHHLPVPLSVADICSQRLSERWRPAFSGQASPCCSVGPWVQRSAALCSTAIGVPRPRVAAHGITATCPSSICAIRMLLQQHVAIARRHTRSLELSHAADKGAIAAAHHTRCVPEVRTPHTASHHRRSAGNNHIMQYNSFTAAAALAA
jgi:hypothetical protein